MKKKALVILLSLIAAVCLIFGLAACTDGDSGGVDINSDAWGNIYTLEAAYNQATEYGYAGSLEEFIASISGSDGKDGADGVGISGVEINDDGELVVTLTDGSIFNCGQITESASAGTEGLFYYAVTDDFGEIIGYTVRSLGSASDVDIVIPSVYKGKPVTAIGNNAFNECYMIKSVTIPDSITSIGISAFEDCASIESVIIPDSVISIGDSAFHRCTSLTNVTIGNGVTEIGEWAFRDCESLTSITIGSSVSAIGEDAFFPCASLTEVYITDIAAWCGITFGDNTANPLIYGGNLYLNGTLVTDLVIPDGVTYIGDYAFRGCNSLTKVKIGDGVTSIGVYAFGRCASLTDITISDSVTYIDFATFAYCYSLENVILGRGVTSIGNAVFEDCISLTSITIPDSVTFIGCYAFEGCASLERVTFTNTSRWNAESMWQSSEIISISSDDLADTATAAKYLTDTYCYYSWYRS